MKPCSTFSLTVIIMLFYFSILGWIWQSPVAKKNREGVKLYNDGKIDDALAKWRNAQIDSPDKEELHYNIGNALYKQKKYKDAFSEYEKTLDTRNAELQAKAYYNMGNTYYRTGKWPEAIEFYKKALDINPDDQDAKYNIEFIRKKIKENLKKKEAGQQKVSREKQTQARQQQTQAAPAGKKEQGKEGEKEGGKKEKGARKEKVRGKEGAGGKKAEEHKEKRGTKEGEMSKEDALRLLDALKDDEKKLQKQLRTQHLEGQYRVDKDW